MCLCERLRLWAFSNPSPFEGHLFYLQIAQLKYKNGNSSSTQKQPVSDGIVSQWTPARPAIWQLFRYQSLSLLLSSVRFIQGKVQAVKAPLLLSTCWSNYRPSCSFLELANCCLLAVVFNWSVLILMKCVNMMWFSSPELFRISTYVRFPNSGVTERSLAKAGWFYTGVGDRVQCFRCNATAEGWQVGDCPIEKHRQLSPSCSFIQSLPSTANLLSSSHSAFSPLRIAPALAVRSNEVS